MDNARDDWKLFRETAMNLEHVRIFGPDENLSIGEDVHLGEETLINCHDKVTIGDHVMTGQRVMIVSGGHDYKKFGAERVTSTIEKSTAIVIGEGAWICTGAIIAGPSQIGKHCVVAAGAVAQGTFPDYCMIIGNPARAMWIIPHES